MTVLELKTFLDKCRPNSKVFISELCGSFFGRDLIHVVSLCAQDDSEAVSLIPEPFERSGSEVRSLLYSGEKNDKQR